MFRIDFLISQKTSPAPPRLPSVTESQLMASLCAGQHGGVRGRERVRGGKRERGVHGLSRPSTARSPDHQVSAKTTISRTGGGSRAGRDEGRDGRTLQSERPPLCPGGSVSGSSAPHTHRPAAGRLHLSQAMGSLHRVAAPPPGSLSRCRAAGLHGEGQREDTDRACGPPGRSGRRTGSLSRLF